MTILYTYILSFFVLVSRNTGRVIITLYALELDAKPFTVSALAAVIAVMPTALSWHVGRFCDRFGSRWPLILCTVAGALGMLAAYVAPGIATLFVTSFLFGLLLALSVVPLQNLVGLLSGPRDSAKNFGNFSILVSFTLFVGPLMAGFSFDHLGPRVTCLVMVAVLMIPAAILIFWGGILPRGTRAAKPTGGVGALLSESGLWRVLLTSSLMVAGLDLFQVYMPIYGDSIGLSASLIGIVLAIYSFAAFAIRFFMPWLIERLKIERVLAFSFFTGALGLVLVPFFEGLVPIFLVAFLFGLGMGCGQPITLMMTFSTSAKERSAEAMGLRVTANQLTRVVGQFFFGSIASAFGVFFVFWVNAIMLAAGGALSYPRVTDRHDKVG